MKKIIGALLCLCMILCVLPVSVFAASPVNIFNVTVAEPKAGEKPADSASLPATASTYVTKIEWSGELDGNGCFKDNTAYTVYVTVRLKPNQDKYLKYVEGKTKVNGNLASISNISSDKQEAIIFYEFKSGGISASESASVPTKPSEESKMNFNDLSVTDEEWEVLRLCNIERAKKGIDSLSMPQSLQLSCDIREKEIAQYYSYTRPDGSDSLTVISKEISTGVSTGDNLLVGAVSAAQAFNEWMNGPDQRDNILYNKFGYMGVGADPDTKCWVQLFAGRKDIVRYTVSTEQRVFNAKDDIKEHYITLTDKNGIVSYLPLDFDAMKNDNGQYTPRINASNLPVFSLTEEAIETEKNKPVTTEKIENLSLHDYEWEVLRITNMERAKEGLDSLSMPQALQLSCNVREKEVVEVFSHTRPDGTQWHTTLSREMLVGRVAENIAKGQADPAQVMTSWMNSPGHHANIMTPELGYLGVGYEKVANGWVQIFGTRSEVVAYEVSTPQRVFESNEDIRDHHMTLVDQYGVVSFLPLDFDSMKVSGGKYIPRINASGINLPVFSIGNPATQQPEEPAEQKHAEQKPAENAPVYTKFTDVKPDAYYAEAVDWAVKKNITAGTSDTTFSPDNTCTRAQILTFLWRAVGSPKMSGANPFSDVKQMDYYYDAALWANSKGMITGNTFAGDTPCTRSATVIYLWKNAGSPSASYSGNFSDVSSSSDYAQAVAWAVANSVTSGTSATTFSPDTTCTRGQIVTFLMRALNK